MRVFSLFIILSISSINLYAQEDSYDKKVRKLLEISDVVGNFNKIITNLIEVEKESLKGIVEEAFFIQFEAEMKTIGLNKLIPKFSEIYKKHLTEEDLEGIITFYESAIGQKLIKKNPLILKDAMDIGAEWGEEITEVIIAKIKDSKEIKFNKKIEADCTHFKEGKFKSLDDKGILFERIGNIQIEKFEDTFTKFKIEWVSNNKYLLTPLNQSKDSELKKVIVNIYEVNDNSYKWIGTISGFDYFVEGELIKIE